MRAVGDRLPAPGERRALFVGASLAVAVISIWWLAGGADPLAPVREHWPVTLTMVFGSLIAGSTSEGGGAVAFPVFTKVLGIVPEDAKLFSLAIQSVGMSAAAIAIFAARIPIEARAVIWAGFGGIPGLVIGSFVFAPLLPPPVVKFSFTVMAASFAITLWTMNRGEIRRHARIPRWGCHERCLLFAAGCLGGVMSGLVGNGIDLVVFSLLVLLFRVSEKIATPTSVVLMAGNAVFGFFFHVVVGDFHAGVRDMWLAAVPVVVIGAPLGALLCGRMRRRAIARFLILLIVIEAVTSLWLIPLSPRVLVAAGASFLLFSLTSLWMSRSDDYRPATDLVGS